MNENDKEYLKKIHNILFTVLKKLEEELEVASNIGVTDDIEEDIKKIAKKIHELYKIEKNHLIEKPEELLKAEIEELENEQKLDRLLSTIKAHLPEKDAEKIIYSIRSIMNSLRDTIELENQFLNAA